MRIKKFLEYKNIDHRDVDPYDEEIWDYEESIEDYYKLLFNVDEKLIKIHEIKREKKCIISFKVDYMFSNDSYLFKIIMHPNNLNTISLSIYDKIGPMDGMDLKECTEKELVDKIIELIHDI